MHTMKKINIKKVSKLLKENSTKQVDLARFIGITTTGLSMALTNRRPLPMNYVFDIASFFNVDPLSLTVDDACIYSTSKDGVKQGVVDVNHV